MTPEEAQLVLTAVTAAAALALVWATLRLATHTEILARATNDLRSLQEAHERAEGTRRERDRLARLLRVANDFMRLDPQETISSLRSDHPYVPDHTDRGVRDLHEVADYARDKISGDHVLTVLDIFDRARRGDVIKQGDAEGAGRFLTSVKADVAERMPEWRRKLAAISSSSSCATRDDVHVRRPAESTH